MKRSILNIRFPSIVFAMVLLSGSLLAQNNQAAVGMQNRVKQIFEYSNSQNWNALRESFADTMKMYSLKGAIIMNNPDDLIAYFKSNYAKFPNEHSKIEKLMILGNKAIIKEKITGHETNEPIYDVLIFEFTENKIASAWIIFEQ